MKRSALIAAGFAAATILTVGGAAGAGGDTTTTEPPTTATDPPTTVVETTTTAEVTTSAANTTTTITIPTTPSTEPESTTTPTNTTPGNEPTKRPQPASQEPSTGTTTPSSSTSGDDPSTEPATEDLPPLAPNEARTFAAFTVETQTAVTTTTTMPSNKVFVCKYEGTPGIDERLQTGQNPISVAWQPGRSPGEYFNDAQGRSYSLAWDIGQDEPDPNECPPPNTGTTTTTSSTTSSTSSTTTSTTTSSTTTTEPQCPDPPCIPDTQATTSSTTTQPGTTTTTSVAPTTTTSSTTSSTLPASSSTTLPETFEFGAAATVCVAEVPTIRINFQNTFPELAGQTGTLTMRDINGNVVSTQELVYAPGTTVDLLYPGTSVNADGTIDDVPGWILTDDGFWIRDPSDEFLREGIDLTYTVNPTATASVEYPPESSTCANPDGPFPPSPTTIPGESGSPSQLPATQ